MILGHDELIGKGQEAPAASDPTITFVNRRIAGTATSLQMPNDTVTGDFALLLAWRNSTVLAVPDTATMTVLENAAYESVMSLLAGHTIAADAADTFAWTNGSSRAYSIAYRGGTEVEALVDTGLLAAGTTVNFPAITAPHPNALVGRAVFTRPTGAATTFGTMAGFTQSHAQTISPGFAFYTADAPGSAGAGSITLSEARDWLAVSFCVG